MNSTPAAGIVPNIKSHGSARTRHSLHFGQRLVLVRHKIEYQCGNNNIPACRPETQGLCIANVKLGAIIGYVRSGPRNEPFGRVDGDQTSRLAARQNSTAQSTSSAANFQPIQILSRPKPLEKGWCNLAAPPPHIEIVAVTGLPGVVPECLRHGRCSHNYSLHSTLRLF